MKKPDNPQEWIGRRVKFVDKVGPIERVEGNTCEVRLEGKYGGGVEGAWITRWCEIVPADDQFLDANGVPIDVGDEVERHGDPDLVGTITQISNTNKLILKVYSNPGYDGRRGRFGESVWVSPKFQVVTRKAGKAIELSNVKGEEMSTNNELRHFDDAQLEAMADKPDMVAFLRVLTKDNGAIQYSHPIWQKYQRRLAMRDPDVIAACHAEICRVEDEK